jgi:hypothetical protein
MSSAVLYSLGSAPQPTLIRFQELREEKVLNGFLCAFSKRILAAMSLSDNRAVRIFHFPNHLTDFDEI